MEFASDGLALEEASLLDSSGVNGITMKEMIQLENPSRNIETHPPATISALPILSREAVRQVSAKAKVLLACDAVLPLANVLNDCALMKPG